MQNNIQPSSPLPERGPGYEPTQVNATGILVFMGILLAIILAAHFIVTRFSDRLARHADALDQQSSREQAVPAITASRAYFPPPNEQPFPKADFEAFRAQEDAELNSYGWIDKKAGIVRIPIDHAMDLLLQQGLPTRSNIAEDKTGPSNLQIQQERVSQITPDGKETDK